MLKESYQIMLGWSQSMWLGGRIWWKFEIVWESKVGWEPTRSTIKVCLLEENGNTTWCLLEVGPRFTFTFSLSSSIFFLFLSSQTGFKRRMLPPIIVFKQLNYNCSITANDGSFNGSCGRPFGYTCITRIR